MTKPTRSPERHRLADAIQRHRLALAQQERVVEAAERLRDEEYDVLQPAVAAAAEALEEAKAARPEALVSAALGEPADDAPTVDQAEAALADARRRLGEVRQARKILAEEAEHARRAANIAERDLDAALKAAIAADPATRGALDEFFRLGRRVLRLDRVLKTLGHGVGGVSADDIGLHFRIGDIVARDGHGSAYRPDPAWKAALAALRNDPDAPLPALPPEEPDDAGDRDSRPAAA